MQACLRGLLSRHLRRIRNHLALREHLPLRSRRINLHCWLWRDSLRCPTSLIVRIPGASVTDTPKIEEEKVFAGKKSYSMVLNMPNLNSSGGSWVIHFAQLDETDHDKSDISAPVATVKVDPAYPAALRRELIEGTVVLYAVIRKDGTVSDVRVLRSVQNQLDESARTALLQWHFNPGTKRGSAVDLEAVDSGAVQSARATVLENN